MSVKLIDVDSSDGYVQLLLTCSTKKIESLPWWNYEYFIYTFKDVPILTGYVSNNELIVSGNGNIDYVIDYNWGRCKNKSKTEI
jgi:hypothetical protein